jgi:hypothetical protein
VSSDTDRYGPQTEQIEDLFGLLGAATGEQLQQIAVTGADAYAIACDSAYDTAAYATNADAIYASYAAAYAYAVDVADADVYADTYADVVAYAAVALAVRHLISEDGFTWEHYRTLTEPVAFVLGALHPED